MFKGLAVSEVRNAAFLVSQCLLSTVGSLSFALLQWVSVCYVFQSMECLSLTFFFCQVKVSPASWVFFVPEASGSWAFVSLMKQIKVIQPRLQVAIPLLAEGRNLGLEKGNHQSLFLFRKLFLVEVACTAPTVMREFFSLYLGPSRVCKGGSLLHLPGSFSSFFYF